MNCRAFFPVSCNCIGVHGEERETISALISPADVSEDALTLCF